MDKNEITIVKKTIKIHSSYDIIKGAITEFKLSERNDIEISFDNIITTVALDMLYEIKKELSNKDIFISYYVDLTNKKLVIF